MSEIEEGLGEVFHKPYDKLIEFDTDGNAPDESNVFIRSKVGESIRFEIPVGSPLLFARSSVCLETNCPPSDEHSFDKSTFYSLVETLSPLAPSSPTTSASSTIWSTDLSLSTSGAFTYRLKFIDPSSGETRHGREGSFCVDPKLMIAGTTLPRRAIIIQTVLTKCLGTLDRWSSVLGLSSSTNYNMIHFTPVQPLGSSNSAYSIADQLDISPTLFDATIHGTNLSTTQKSSLLRSTIQELEQELGLHSFVDVVWNHTASDSPWLQDHPEGAYNLKNSPHLRAAFDLDEGLSRLSERIEDSEFGANIPNVQSVSDVDHLLNIVKENTLKEISLWEYFVIDVESTAEKLKDSLFNFHNQESISDHGRAHPHIISWHPNSDPAYRLKMLKEYAISSFSTHCRQESRSINPVIALLLYIPQSAVESFEALSESRIASQVELLKEDLNLLNLDFYRDYDSFIHSMLSNLRSALIWFRLERSDGPKEGPIGRSSPIVPSYFVRLPGYKSVSPEVASTSAHDPRSIVAERVLACNGWIWGGNPLNDFAGPESHSYLKRELIVWSDCVKLKYGDSPADNPWLWSHMTAYTVAMASIFTGFRIDNAHSTPLHVAEHLLTEARKVQKNLYVTAELFTGSEEIDLLYIRRLAITSIVREALAANSAQELSSYVYRYGSSEPVGCFLTSGSKPESSDLIPPGLFYDCTHDNETPMAKRTAQDALATAAIVAMSDCAIASVWGFDLLLPLQLSVVSETRLYPTDLERSIAGGESAGSAGIITAKSIFNSLHVEMAASGYNQTHVHQDGDIVSVYRHSAASEEGVLLIAACAFDKSSNSPVSSFSGSPFTVHGVIKSCYFAGHVSILTDTSPAGFKAEPFTSDPRIRGLDSKLTWTKDLSSPILDSLLSIHHASKNSTHIHLKSFPPGAVALFRVTVESPSLPPLRVLSTKFFSKKRFPCLFCPKIFMSQTYLDDHLKRRHGNEKPVHMAEIPVKGLTAIDVNRLLYQCAVEESEHGGGVYHIPNFGNTVYAGLQGFISILEEAADQHNMAHPLAEHLRGGDWALDYVCNRLSAYPSLAPIQSWLSFYISAIKDLPRSLIPKYFHLVLTTLYHALRYYAETELMSDFIHSHPNGFVRDLAMTSIALHAQVPSAPLLKSMPGSSSLAAGLPHFASGYMRCWGRDTFIALPGLFLVTGQFGAAKDHILAGARSLRHGLIPNLLDGGSNPRYNARDATWFWLESLQQYVERAPNGEAILTERIRRIFPKDDQTPVTGVLSDRKDKLVDVIQEIFQKHASGIHFREWNAGSMIDDKMKDPGFNVDIRLDAKTGLIYGGNLWNCGTWMDKMGESRAAGTHGTPATPRDGAPVEIIGLLKSTLRWLIRLHADGKYPYSQVRIEGQSLSFKDWNDRLTTSFEKHFWIPADPSTDDQFIIEKEIVNNRGMYKDTVGSQLNWQQYQMRPNQVIALAVAPELFNVAHARIALESVEKSLLGPYGMKTLDESDLRYRGFYDNSLEVNDPYISRGFNYHQGPEWLWVTGFFLRAKLAFIRLDDRLSREEKAKGVASIQAVLARLSKKLSSSPWKGLPELTNANGSHCSDSCPIQAWSSSTLLDTYWDLAAKK